MKESIEDRLAVALGVFMTVVALAILGFAGWVIYALVTWVTSK